MQLEAVVLKDVLPYLQARRTFIRRTAYAGAAAFVVIIGGGGVAFDNAKAQSSMGGTLFNIILWAMLISGTFECAFLGATAISSERQRNTVDVWILAGMEHFWMVAAKVGCVLTRAAAVVLALVVPGAVALYLGGRTITDATVGFLAVASIMVFAAALSVSISSLCRRNADAVPASLTILVATAVVPGVALNAWAGAKAWGSHFAAGVIQFHPFTLLLGIGEQRGQEAVSAAFWGLVASIAMAIVLMIMAGAHLRGEGAFTIGRIQPVRALDRVLTKMFPSFFRLFKPAPGNPDVDPALWRERIAIDRSKALYGGMTIIDKLLIGGGITAAFVQTAMGWGGAGVLAPSPGGSATAHLLEYIYAPLVLVVFLYTVGFLVRASQAFSREFESGQMDLLQLTRLSGEEIVSGKLRAYVRHYSPLLIIAVPLGLCAFVTLANNGEPFSTTQSQYGTFSLGVPWVTAAGWALSGFAAAGAALLASLYFMIGTRAMFATMVLYFLPTVVLMLFLRSVSSGSGLSQLIVQTLIGAFILSRVAYWARAHMGFKSRHECLLLTAMACVGAAASGPVLGPFVIYLVAKTLMQKNFNEFLLHEADRYRIILRRPALSYETGGAYMFTHLGVPPHIERRLNMPQTRNVIRDEWKY